MIGKVVMEESRVCPRGTLSLLGKPSVWYLYSLGSKLTVEEMRRRAKLELKEAKTGREKSKKLLGSGGTDTGEVWRLDIWEDEHRPRSSGSYKTSEGN